MSVISLNMLSKLLALVVKCFYLQLILLKAVQANGENGYCGAEFQGKCWCGFTEYDRSQKYVVNCTNGGFSDTSVLEHMPPSVEVLIFTGNVLVNLPWNIFGKIGEYPMLRVIDMSNNHIREIRGKTYHHVQQVERLILNHNNLSISTKEDDANHLHPRIFSNFLNLKSLHLTNAFSDYSSPELSQDLHEIFSNSNLTRLLKLHLEQNEISNFKDPNVFCSLPQLEDLHLGDNALKEINFNISCMKNLRFLDFERNRFESLTQHDIDALKKLEQEHEVRPTGEKLIFDFSLNPFSCDCTIYPFVNWLHSTNVAVREKERLICYQNDDHVERILSLNLQKCIVKTQRHKTTSYHEIFLVFFSAVVIFIFIGIIGGLSYINQDRIRDFVSPVVSLRKVHYTTIRDDEIAQEVYV